MLHTRVSGLHILLTYISNQFQFSLLLLFVFPLNMTSIQNSILQASIFDELFIAQIKQLHADISKLESLKPSEKVISLITQLVKLCANASYIDIKSLPEEVLIMREDIISQYGEVEAFLEHEFASFLAKIPYPLKNLHLFSGYKYQMKLVRNECQILMKHGIMQPKKVAFIGSGPIPLTSINMAIHFMKLTHFDNYDIDECANNLASQIVASDSELEKRMKFITCDVMQVGDELKRHDVVFLAALVGKNTEDKVKIIEHIGKHMKNGGVLCLRTAKGPKAFLYHTIEESDLKGFEVLSISHPTNELIHSFIVARKPMA